MKNSRHFRRRYWLVIVLSIVAVTVFGFNAGRALVLDSPQQSDLILVLAGETDIRPNLALELLRRGYGRRVLIDVPAQAKIYAYSQVELAKQYIHGLPEGAAIQICPILGLSTREESHDVATCLKQE